MAVLKIVDEGISTEPLQQSTGKQIPTSLQIFIGPRNEFGLRLPTHILCRNSELLYEAVQGNWVKSIPDDLTFPTIDPNAWQIFVGWMYNGKKELDKLKNLPTNDRSTDIVPWVCVGTGEIVMGARNRVTATLIDCYLLGDFLQSPAFQNDTMEVLRQHAKEIVEKKGWVPLWVNTVSGHSSITEPLRKFIVELISSNCSPATLHNAADLLTSETIRDLAIIATDTEYGSGTPPAPWNQCPCRYHNHPEGTFISPCDDVWGKFGPFEDWEYPYTYDLDGSKW
ncbi:hypothetical protein B7494_g4788 [Chlorociboria aeruginascens]|nr:hypothetical protein B7494_g4788 [Chlorociboria aeruginascens]